MPQSKLMEQIIENLKQIEARITAACERAGRAREEVKLLLATKTVTPERIKVAFEAGYTLIAENKVQELKEKYDALSDVPHTNHFIGHLQTNKVKEILRYGVSCVESVDKLDLAQKLQQRLATEDKHLDVLLQVNTSAEESKYGVAPDKALDLARAVAQCDRLHIKGLMTIGLFSAEEEKVRVCFQLLRRLQGEIAALGLPGVVMEELSMGMSGDLEIAIEEGATIVRVGTAIFGKRVYPDSYYWKESRE